MPPLLGKGTFFYPSLKWQIRGNLVFTDKQYLCMRKSETSSTTSARFCSSLSAWRESPPDLDNLIIQIWTQINSGNCFTSFLCLATLLAWLSPDVQKLSQLLKIWRKRKIVFWFLIKKKRHTFLEAGRHEECIQLLPYSPCVNVIIISNYIMCIIRVRVIFICSSICRCSFNQVFETIQTIWEKQLKNNLAKLRVEKVLTN